MLISLFLVAFTAGSVCVGMPVPESLPDGSRPKLEDPGSFVTVYLKAVDRGQLQIFGHVIDRSMVVPISVEFVYELTARKTTVKVYSTLKIPMPVPGQEDEDYRVFGVSAVMDGGNIVDTESHIWMTR